MLIKLTSAHLAPSGRISKSLAPSNADSWNALRFANVGVYRGCWPVSANTAEPEWKGMVWGSRVHEWNASSQQGAANTCCPPHTHPSGSFDPVSRIISRELR